MKAAPGAPPIPDLSLIISAYSADEFRHLMKTGKGLGDRDLGLMSEKAREAYAHFTAGEVDAVYAYLRACREQIDSKTTE